MNKKLLVCFAALGIALGVSCSSSDGDGNGGEGGEGGESESGGSGGKATGGSGGKASGGSGGKASGGSGGSASGGSGGTAGGAGGTAGGSGGAAGGAGGMKCASVPGGKKVTFDAEGDLWESHPVGRVTPKAMPVLSETQKRGAAGKSMEIEIDTADGLLGAAGGDAGADAAADAMPKREWFFSVKEVRGLAGHLAINKTVSVWVWVPLDHKFEFMQLVHTSPDSYPEGNNWQSQGVTLTPGAWSKVTLLIPEVFKCSGAGSQGWHELGLYFKTLPGAVWKGKFYVDDFEISAEVLQ